ncbi:MULTISPECIES: hypothetical protein [unclassified Lebetimonas]|uniref:hypothetical protein n=1 Tax=unclassified Lebetimonas TaxID=2648158 RepID=UPI0004663855|nr:MULTISPECIES: hypothetical protein [unclassified Lebetimonas]
MPHLIELLTHTDNKTKPKIKPAQNFLLQILKDMEPLLTTHCLIGTIFALILKKVKKCHQ